MVLENVAGEVGSGPELHLQPANPGHYATTSSNATPTCYGSSNSIHNNKSYALTLCEMSSMTLGSALKIGSAKT